MKYIVVSTLYLNVGSLRTGPKKEKRHYYSSIYTTKKGESKMSMVEADGEVQVRSMLVEGTDGGLIINSNSLSNEELYKLTIYLIGQFAEVTEQTYNQVCEDFKENI